MWFPHGLADTNRASSIHTRASGSCQHPPWLALTRALAASPCAMPNPSQSLAAPLQSDNTSNQCQDLPKQGERWDGMTQRWVSWGSHAPSSNKALRLERGVARREERARGEGFAVRKEICFRLMSSASDILISLAGS